ncbi:MAG: cobyrinate a,c-diamide synthase [Nitrospiraceae bacterium]|nr:cobyrinate a,c-diamide synthase [Nitrospiraceae bacterium]
MLSLPRLVVSAVRGGLGKTTFSLGIIGAWRKRGKRIAPFKKGPDFIDAGWLGAASGTACYNLDLFLMEEEQILRSFLRHSASFDGTVIEGNRGLYDGVDESGTYSTARLARMLRAPVILIVDCTKTTSTAAAVVLGCKQLDPDVQIGGVILNNVASNRQEKVIRQAIGRFAGIPIVGAVPRLKHGEFPERHMGLTPLQEHPDVQRAVESAVAVAEQFLDLDAIFDVAAGAPDLPGFDPDTQAPERAGSFSDRPVIGIIRDRAFQFYYPDNLEALEQHGATIRELNALTDRELPDIDCLYIGGGFPETQAAELAANASFCRSLRDRAEKGLPFYAECGGLIYLGRSLRMGERSYPMASVIPADFVLEQRPQAHGYTIVETGGGNPFFPIGTILRGHEFHYSHIVRIDGDLPMIYTMQRGRGIDGRSDGILFKNVVGTYTHVMATGTPQWAAGIVSAARTYRSSRKAGVA